MSVYREKDGYLVREYELHEGGWNQHRTEKATVDIVSTKEFGQTLFLDGEMQLAFQDEYIYHEMLVHPCLSSSSSRKRICIIGGGDGCALREVLKWEDVEHVDILDWDTKLIQLFQTRYTSLNFWSYDDKRVSVETNDIRSYKHTNRTYDCILVDLVDPEPSQSELWLDVLAIVKAWIVPGGSIVLNAGGITPWQTTTMNWLLQHIESTVEFRRHLYKVFVPSFAREWSFILLNKAKKVELSNLPSNLRYIDDTAWHQAYTYGWTKNYLETLYGYQ
jgi:spermidine synthase